MFQILVSVPREAFPWGEASKSHSEEKKSNKYSSKDIIKGTVSPFLQLTRGVNWTLTLLSTYFDQKNFLC